MLVSFVFGVVALLLAVDELISQAGRQKLSAYRLSRNVLLLIWGIILIALSWLGSCRR